MENQIRTKFPVADVNGCLSKVNDLNIYIKDQPDGKCILTGRNNVFDFEIENPAGKEINILSIDQCVFNHKSQHKKCDFAAFDNNIFVFVEIKDTYKRSSSHKRKAKEQLESTILKFKKSIDFNGFKLYAIISWRYRPVRPVVSTAMQSAKLDFLTRFNVSLLEGNRFTFS